MPSFISLQAVDVYLDAVEDDEDADSAASRCDELRSDDLHTSPTGATSPPGPAFEQLAQRPAQRGKKASVAMCSVVAPSL